MQTFDTKKVQQRLAPKKSNRGWHQKFQQKLVSCMYVHFGFPYGVYSQFLETIIFRFNTIQYKSLPLARTTTSGGETFTLTCPSFKRKTCCATGESVYSHGMYWPRRGNLVLDPGIHLVADSCDTVSPRQPQISSLPHSLPQLERGQISPVRVNLGGQGGKYCH